MTEPKRIETPALAGISGETWKTATATLAALGAGLGAIDDASAVDCAPGLTLLNGFGQQLGETCTLDPSALNGDEFLFQADSFGEYVKASGPLGLIAGGVRVGGDFYGEGGYYYYVGSYARLFAEGDTIDASAFSSGGGVRYAGFRYNAGGGYPSGYYGATPWTQGTTGFVGLTFNPSGFGSGYGFGYSALGPYNYFGFAEVTIGSLTFGNIQFSNSPNTPITTASTPQGVPEPGSLALLAAGAAGIAAVRRRRRPN